MTNKVINRVLGYGGFMVLSCSFLVAFFGNKFFKIWITPLCWSGYIFFVDYVVLRIKGKSLFFQNKEGFLVLWIFSCPLWLIFEYYNLFLKSWIYTGLPSFWLTVLGMYISFSTILPGLFETASLVNCIFRLNRIRIRHQTPSKAKLVLLIFLGMVCLVLPLMFPVTHLYGLIWLGFLLLIDPVNYLLGLSSFLKERQEGRIYQFFRFL